MEEFTELEDDVFDKAFDVSEDEMEEWEKEETEQEKAQEERIKIPFINTTQPPVVSSQAVNSTNAFNITDVRRPF